MFHQSSNIDRSEIMKEDPSGNWNISKDFSENILLKGLIKADEYKRVAYFGAPSIIELLQLDEQGKVKLRLEAFNYLLYELSNLYSQSSFAIKIDKDLEELKKLNEELEYIETKTNLIFNIVKRDSQDIIKINEDIFRMFLKRLTEILEKIEFYMNRSNLIFYNYTKFDPREYKKKIIEKMVENG